MSLPFDRAASIPWAIEPAALQTILEIAQRQDVSPETVAAWKPGAGLEALAAEPGERLNDKSRVMLRDGVAIVSMIGPVFRYASLFSDISGATSYQRLAADLRAAETDPRVRAILHVIDSPGGEVNGTAEYAAMLRGVKKPLAVYAGGMMASAGYWVGAAAPRIVMASTALAGSIGVVGTYYDQRERDARNGVRKIEIVSSQSPDKRLDPADDAGRAKLQATIDKLAEEFVSSVAGFRGVSREKVLADFGQGGLLLGAEAVAAGMADAIGSFESVLAELAAAGSGRIYPVIGAAAPKAKESTMTNQERAAEFAAQHPEAAALLRAEGARTAEAAAQAQAQATQQQAIAAAVATERNRIAAINKATLKGHEAMAAAAIAEGHSPGDFALAQIAAQQAAGGKLLAQLQAETVPVPPAPNADQPGAGAAASDADLPLEQRAKAAWDKSAALRASYAGNFEAYLAYSKASEAGQVRELRAAS